MKKIFLSVCFILISISFSNFALAESCYQESANVSTTCGGLSTGTYSISDYWTNNAASNVYDGDWSTGSSVDIAGHVSRVYVDYTKPTNVQEGSLWQISGSGGIRNLTIPPGCWNHYSTKISLMAESYATSTYVDNWYCYDAGWVTLSTGGPSTWVYEEAMIWNITSSSQNETINQTSFWNLSDMKLYPSSLSYLVGIGTANPITALDVAGTILARNNLNVTNKVFISNGSLQLGTQDAFGRNQIWNFLPSSVLRLGSLASDGDAQTVSSEGIVVYGKNIQGDTMSSPNFGYARIKPDRIGLYSSLNDIADYYFRVDSTGLYLKNNSFTKMFEIIRSTGEIMTLGNITAKGGINTEKSYSVNGQEGITNNTGFWMCKDLACSTICQVDIKGGIIVGCN